jgi:hypothetical protein
MGLSIPTVIYGKNFTTRSVAKSHWTVVPFKCMGESVEVQICVAPSKEAGGLTRLAKDQLSAVLSILD